MRENQRDCERQQQGRSHWGATLAAVLAFVVFPSGALIGAGALAAAFAAKGQIRRQLFWVSGVAIAVTLLYALFLLPAGFVVTGDDQGVPIN